MDKEKKDNVGVAHPDYAEAYTLREKYEAIIEGTDEIKEHAKSLIPKFPAEDAESYNVRIATLTHFNLAKKARDIMNGLMFTSDIELGEDVAPAIVTLTENIDNEGNHLDVFARKVAELGWEGYTVILADAPDMKADSLEAERQLGLRPVLKAYEADDIWNWAYQINPVSKAKELCLLVLRETTSELTGQFTFSDVTRFRVYRKVNGVITWQVFLEVTNDKGEKDYIEEAFGTYDRFDRIPVAVVGELGECSPLMDIAYKNLEHTQTYSDYKTLIHKTCVPMLMLLGFSADEAKQMTVSGSTALVGPETAKPHWIEVAGSSLDVVRQSLTDIQEQIAKMTLELLSDKTKAADMTATESILDSIAETSELRVYARQLQDALEESLGNLAVHLGLPRESGGSLTLGASWNAVQPDSQSITLPDGRTIGEFEAVLDLVNKGEGILTLEEQRAMLFPEATPQETAQALKDLADNQPVKNAQMMVN